MIPSKMENYKKMDTENHFGADISAIESSGQAIPNSIDPDVTIQGSILQPTNRNSRTVLHDQEDDFIFKFSENVNNVHSKTVQQTLNSLKIMYTNADNLLNKMGELKLRIKDNKYNIIAITEIFPKVNINIDFDCPEWDLIGFNKFTPPSLVSTGRGCVLYCSKELSCFNISKKEYNKVEHVSVSIKCDDGYKLVTCTYRSPNDNGEEILNELEDILNTDSYKDINFNYVLHMGDFNFKYIDFFQEILLKGEDHISTKFCEIVKETFLHQHIRHPTRFQGSNIPSILDLVFTYEEGTVGNIEHCAP